MKMLVPVALVQERANVTLAHNKVQDETTRDLGGLRLRWILKLNL